MGKEMPLPDVPPKLIDAAHRKQLFVLVGAGASFGAGLPRWDELLAGLTDEAQRTHGKTRAADIASAIDERDLLLRASMIRNILSDDVFRAKVVEIIGSKSSMPSVLHQALAALPGAGFLTTNYDRLLEDALHEASGVPVSPLLANVPDQVNKFGPGQVLKLHGDIGDPQSLVLPLSDYIRVQHQEPAAWRELIKAILQRGQLLLVGYSYRDPDIQDIWSELSAAYRGKIDGPWWLTEENFQTKTFASEHGLRLLGLVKPEQAAEWIASLKEGVKQRARDDSWSVVPALAGFAEGKLAEDEQEARKYFDEGRYETALEAYKAITGQVSNFVGETTQPGMSARLARARLNSGCCLLCLQREEEAQVALNVVDPEELDSKGKISLAQALAQVGELQRALDVLPDDPAPERESTRQIIEIFSGRLPDPLDTDPWVQISASRVDIPSGLLATAADRVIQCWQGIEGQALLLASGVSVLWSCLSLSLFSDPDLAEPIPLARRDGVVRKLEEGYKRLWDRKEETPTELRERFLVQSYFYYRQALDEERAARVLEYLGFDPLERVELAGTLPPWAHSIEQVQELAISDLDGAIDLARRTQEKWPGRAPVEWTLAVTLLKGQLPQEALPHAERAAEIFPCRGYRLLRAEARMRNSDPAGAWGDLEDWEESEEPKILKLRAAIADQNKPDQVIELTRRYLAREPGDVHTWRLLAHRLYHFGRPKEAAEEAWRLVTGPFADRLSVEDLGQCAFYQTSQPATKEERFLRIAAELKRLFPLDIKAEGLRFQLLSAIDLPAGTEGPDLVGLLNAGELIAVQFEHAQAVLEKQLISLSQVWEAYRRGDLGFETLAMIKGLRAAKVLSSASREESRFLGPMMSDQPDLFNLKDAWLLVGEVELLVLQDFGLLDNLLSAIGNGKLVTFADVADRITQTAAAFHRESPDGDLALYAGLQKWLDHQVAEGKVVKRISGSESTILLASGAREAQIGGFSVRDLSGVWHQAGELTTIEAARIGWSPGQAGIPVPSSLVLTLPSLLELQRAGLLDRLEDTESELTIEPEEYSRLGGQVAASQLNADAAERAHRLHGWLGSMLEAGRVTLTERPDRCELPGPVSPAAQFLRDAVARSATWLEALDAHPTWQLLTGDFQIWSLARGMAGPWTMLIAWPASEGFWSTIKRFGAMAVRTIDLPGLACALRREASYVPLDCKVEERLTELGFEDAFDGDALLRLASKYGGLQGSRPSSLLGLSEATASQIYHPGFSHALLAIVSRYSKAVWQAWRGEQPKGAERPGSEMDSLRESISRTLLARIEGLDRSSGGWGLEQFLVSLASEATNDLDASTVPSGDDYLTSEGSPAGKLWSYLCDWAGTESTRLAILGRALTLAFTFLDRVSEPSGPGKIRVGPLFLAMTILSGEPVRRTPKKARKVESWPMEPHEEQSAISLFKPGLAALAILSAIWEEKPLDLVGVSLEVRGVPLRRTMESLLCQAAEGFSLTGPPILDHELRWGVTVNFSEDVDDPLPIRLWAPPEALILRSRSADLAVIIRILADHTGPHDGVLSELLRRLATKPEDQALRKEVAYRATTSPFRMLRADPTWVLSWRIASVTPGSFQPAVESVRRLLSEPGPLPAESLSSVLLGRVIEGGPWYNRDDRLELAGLASQLPGLPSILSLRWRLDADRFPAEVEDAWQRLSRPESQTAARLCSDIVFLRAAAAQAQFTRIDGTEIDLQERLPSLLADVLRSCSGDSNEENPPGSGKRQVRKSEAESERSLQQLELQIVRNCRSLLFWLPGSLSLNPRDQVWLTWRLFQWSIAQVESLPPWRRGRALENLAKKVPQRFDFRATEILDPVRFGPLRWDHRLAAVVWAIANMDKVSWEIVPGLETTRGSSSGALESVLVKLASRTLTTEEQELRILGNQERGDLGWEGPSAIPDLALDALLNLNAERLLELDPGVRLRWLKTALDRHGETRMAEPLAAKHIAMSLAICSRLENDERNFLKDNLGRLDAFQPAARLPQLAAVTLYAAGASDLEEHARIKLEASLGEPMTGYLFGLYTATLSSADAPRAETEVQRFLELARARHLPVVDLIEGLGTVALGGSESPHLWARGQFERLAKDVAFREEGAVARLASLLGVG